MYTTQDVTDKQHDEFKKLSAPLIKFLNDHYHPHVQITITPTSAELVEGVMAYATNEFVRD